VPKPGGLSLCEEKSTDYTDYTKEEVDSSQENKCARDFSPDNLETFEPLNP
jgi:hypothetical protein